MNQKVFLFQGMCYSGKTTLGKLTANMLGVSFLDSRDLFLQTHNISEIDFLKKYGKNLFIEAEKECLKQDFKGVLSLAGSAIYYDKEMTQLKQKYTIIWLDVDYNIIVQRQNAESKERPIVYPDGINSFLELYNQRHSLYEKYYDYKITVTENEPIKITLEKIKTLITSIS